MPNLFDVLGQMFSYTFTTRAVIVGGLVSLCAALLGVSLVLKRYSMIGDGLSHVGFGALSVAIAFNFATLPFSLFVVVVTAFLLLRISERSKIKGDAAIALISSSSMAIGVIVTALKTGMNLDVCNYMFGTIVAMTKTDLYISIPLAIIVIGVFALFYNHIFAITFDENFSRATGIHVEAYNMLIALLTALVIVIGMRIMGSLMISSLIIFPALTSMRIFGSFKRVIISSAILSIVNFFLGVVVSFVWRIPAGASVVGVNLVVFILFSVLGILLKKHRGGGINA